MNVKQVKNLQFGERCQLDLKVDRVYVYFYHHPLKNVKEFAKFTFYNVNEDRVYVLYMNVENTVWTLNE